MATRNVSIMVAIQKRETELKVKVLEAKRQAEAVMTKARKESAKICQKARSKGEDEAKALLSDGRAKAKDESEKLLASTEKTISSLNRLAKNNYGRAVELVVMAVTGETIESQDSVSGNRASIVRTINQDFGEIVEAADGETDAR